MDDQCYPYTQLRERNKYLAEKLGTLEQQPHEDDRTPAILEAWRADSMDSARQIISVVQDLQQEVRTLREWQASTNPPSVVTQADSGRPLWSLRQPPRVRRTLASELLAEDSTLEVSGS